MAEIVCLLDQKDQNYTYCGKVGACLRCGFNQEVRAQREQLLREKGLTMGEDGLARLILPSGPRKDGEEEVAILPWKERLDRTARECRDEEAEEEPETEERLAFTAQII